MTTEDAQGKPAEVPERATQAGEIRDRWSWVEACAWTERMLMALETGVKGGKWFALIDKVHAERKRQRISCLFEPSISLTVISWRCDHRLP